MSKSDTGKIRGTSTKMKPVKVSSNDTLYRWIGLETGPADREKAPARLWREEVADVS